MLSAFHSISYWMAGLTLESSVAPGVMGKMPILECPSLGLCQGDSRCQQLELFMKHRIANISETSRQCEHHVLLYSKSLNRAPKSLAFWKTRNIRLLRKQDSTKYRTSQCRTPKTLIRSAVLVLQSDGHCLRGPLSRFTGFCFFKFLMPVVYFPI